MGMSAGTPIGETAKAHLRSLGLGTRATFEDAKAAYRGLVMATHPDRYPRGSPEQRVAEDQLRRWIEAYSWLREHAGAWPDALRESDPPHSPPPSSTAAQAATSNDHVAAQARRPPKEAPGTVPATQLNPTTTRTQQGAGAFAGMLLVIVLVGSLFVKLLRESQPVDSRATYATEQAIDPPPAQQQAAPILAAVIPSDVGSTPGQASLRSGVPASPIAHVPVQAGATGKVEVAPESELDQAIRAFEAADAELNGVYQVIRAKAPAELFLQLRDSERLWIGWRDVFATDNARIVRLHAEEPPSAEQWPEFWEARTIATERRISYLDAWSSSLDDVYGFLEGWSGTWVDGYDGWVYVRQTSDGEFQFAIEVVRGPSFHLGEVAGTAIIAGNVANFETYVDGLDEPARLEFVRRGPIMEVSGSGSIQYFAGAHAYFSGDYARAGELSSRDASGLERALTEPGFSFHRDDY